MATLEDELEDLEEDLEDSKDATGDQAGPLPEPEQSQVAQKLNNSENIIDRIIDRNQEPSLSPPDAGSVDQSVKPTTLPEHAFECHRLAQKAHAGGGFNTPIETQQLRAGHPEGEQEVDEVETRYGRSTNPAGREAGSTFDTE